jgi:hypothetical protein
MAGVDRRMLDRVGAEVARATSIVRYAAASRFSSHTHGGGEEFFVLDGVFSDERGDYPAGSYVRNPPASHHAPRSESGCTIFVKLWQFDPADRTEVRIDTTKLQFLPAPDRPGIELMPLFRDDCEDVRLERWVPGAEVVLPVPSGIELLILAGEIREGGEHFEPQSWLRLPAGATLCAQAGSSGARLWVKLGHLAGHPGDAFATHLGSGPCGTS